MKIGLCRKCISTDMKINLAGFGNPNRKFTGVHDDIYATAVVFEENGSKACIVTADVLGFDRDMLKYIRAFVEERTGIPGNAILFNASHTHSAPQVLIGCNPEIGGYVAEYAHFFYDTVLDTVIKADKDLEDCILSRGEVECYGIGVNRRRIENGVYHFAAFEEGLRNDEVSVIKASVGDRVKAVLFSFTCHPSTTGFDEISADYPGAARRAIEESVPGAVAVFIQGCCGNIRVRTVAPKGFGFRGGTYEDVAMFGNMLADKVISVLSGEMAPLKGSISHNMSTFNVPLADKSSKEEYEVLRDETNVQYLKYTFNYFIENYDALPLTMIYSVQRIDLGDNYSFVALEGEVCVEYDFHMKKLLPHRHVVTAGYSNGSPGYICTSDMYSYGGYEPNDSARCYLLPNGFDPTIEQVILEHAKEIMK